MNYEKIFKSLPGLYLILDIDRPKFTILAATDSYTVQTLTTGKEIIGKGVFEVFPPDPKITSQGMNTLAKSLATLINTGRSHKIDSLPYSILDANNIFRERVWCVENIPVFDANKLLYIINSVHDITDLQRMEKQSENSTKVLSELLKLNDQYYNQLRDK